MAPRRKTKETAGGKPTKEDSLPMPKASPEKSSNEEQFSGAHVKQKVTIIGNPSPMYKFFHMVLQFIVLMRITDSIVAEMARDIVVEDLQDEILKGCYSNLNPRQYFILKRDSLRGMLVDGQNSEVQGTMLTHILDQFEDKTDEDLLLQ
ncbi:hypothetical protein GYMLUDRAFT_62881 [Collybiopsis luxurians FD-317 M1]|uniref:Uncharacterized protein n=1 Tax=Collybiopsis luxurians FD-317 M1 TaxID=944289 RepID=A0A0D0BY73_9AGAR|nr:hypothetical protein GYMLUDRAFT_62881 [Collybiopsis luxurians FD-317 M1]